MVRRAGRNGIRGSRLGSRTNPVGRMHGERVARPIGKAADDHRGGCHARHRGRYGPWRGGSGVARNGASAIASRNDPVDRCLGVTGRRAHVGWRARHRHCTGRDGIRGH